MREDFHYDEIASHLFELSNRLGQYMNNYYTRPVIIITMPIWFSRKLLINGLTKKGQANSKIKQIKRTTFTFVHLFHWLYLLLLARRI